MILEKNYRTAEPDITVLELTGRLSAGNSLLSLENELRNLVGPKATKLVIDVGGLEYLDSAGVGALLAISGATATAGGRMILAGAGGRIRDVLELTQVNRIITIADSADAACRQF
jgi:anti-sigma B factor antagonist